MSAQLTQPLGQNNCRQKAYKYLHFCFKKKKRNPSFPHSSPYSDHLVGSDKGPGGLFLILISDSLLPQPQFSAPICTPSPEPLLGSEGHTDLLLVNNHLSRQSPSHSALLAQLSPFHLLFFQNVDVSHSLLSPCFPCHRVMCLFRKIPLLTFERGFGGSKKPMCSICHTQVETLCFAYNVPFYFFFQGHSGVTIL